MSHFNYPYPDRRTTTSLRDADCRFEGTPWVGVERVYVDIVSALVDSSYDEETFRREAPGERGSLQRAMPRRFKRDERVSDTNPGVLRLHTAEEFKEEVSEPTWEPIRTLHQYGNVPGCHDDVVLTTVAWYEMIDLSWPKTCEDVVSWLRDTDAWDRDGFEEAMPAEFVEKKRHVHEAGYGWEEKAVLAKRVIDRYRS